MNAVISELQLTPKSGQTNNQRPVMLDDLRSTGIEADKVSSFTTGLSGIVGDRLGSIIDIKV